MPLARNQERAGGSVWRRVQWLNSEIQAGRAPSKQQLRDRFGVRESCATQTIAFMREQLQLPVIFDRSRKGYVYRGELPALPAAHPGLLLSSREMAALHLALALSQRYLDAYTVRDLHSLTGRLVAAAAAPLAGEHQRWGQDVVFTGSPPLPARYLSEVKQAIEGRHVLSIDYGPPGSDEWVTREIEPHLLVNAGGDWLLVAWDRERDAPRSFALARMGWCETLNERFERRPELNGEVFTKHQFLSEGGRDPYLLVARFTGKHGRVAAERKWHPTQQTHTAEDGRLELRLTVSGTGDMLRWLLSFGSGVEVLSPEWMRRLVHEEAVATAQLNSGSG